jgi:phage shock protein PspC (stress-responsive transcriptional regulator)
VNTARPEGSLLAGVCTGIARTFDWNVWVLRALFVLFLLIKTLWAIVAYAALALAFHLLDGEWPGRRKYRGGLESPELAGRNQRIADLERRFEELERGDRGNT